MNGYKKQHQTGIALFGVVLFIIGVIVLMNGGGEGLSLFFTVTGTLASSAALTVRAEGERIPRGFLWDTRVTEHHHHHHYSPKTYSEGTEHRTERPDGTVDWERRVRRWE